jgi:transcriptional regulator with XRE-family HTH domain
MNVNPNLRAPRKQRKPLEPHFISMRLRELRIARGLSLQQIAAQHPDIPAVVLGSYERGAREATVRRVDYIAQTVYGLRLDLVPIGQTVARSSGDIVADLRAIADQLEQREPHIVEKLSGGRTPATDAAEAVT